MYKYTKLTRSNRLLSSISDLELFSKHIVTLNVANEGGDSMGVRMSKSIVMHVRTTKTNATARLVQPRQSRNSNASLCALPLDVVSDIITLSETSFTDQLRTACTLSLVCTDLKPIVHTWLTSVQCIDALAMSTTSTTFERAIRHMHSLSSLRLECQHKCDDDTLELVCRCCPMLTHIDLRGCEHITDSGIANLVDACTHLSSIDVSRCFKLTESSIISLSRCVDLTSLDVSCCYKISNLDAFHTSDGDATRHSAGTRRCEQFSTLNVSMLNNRLLTEASIVALVTKCTRLTSLDVSRLTNLTNSAVEAIAKTCVHLVDVNISFCSRVSDVGMYALAKCAHLTTLYAGNLFKMTDAGIGTLSAQCTQLCTLHLPYCSQVRDLGCATRHWSRMTSLDLTQVTTLTDANVVSIACHCSQLTSVRMAHCSSITDASAFALSHCPMLTVIDMSQCFKLTDDGVVAIATNCKRLTCLRLEECTRLSPTSTSALSQSTNLRQLDIAHCYGMNGPTNHSRSYARAHSQSFSLSYHTRSMLIPSTYTRFRKLHMCTNLTSLNMCDMYRLTNSDVSAIARACTLLIHLNVCNCYRLTDAAIDVVATHCPCLETLFLLGCHRLEGKYVDALGLCPKLRSLQLPEHTTSDVVDSIVLQCPHLTYFLCGHHVVQYPHRSVFASWHT